MRWARSASMSSGRWRRQRGSPSRSNKDQTTRKGERIGLLARRLGHWRGGNDRRRQPPLPRGPGKAQPGRRPGSPRVRVRAPPSGEAKRGIIERGAAIGAVAIQPMREAGARRRVRARSTAWRAPAAMRQGSPARADHVGEAGCSGRRARGPALRCDVAGGVEGFERVKAARRPPRRRPAWHQSELGRIGDAPIGARGRGRSRQGRCREFRGSKARARRRSGLRAGSRRPGAVRPATTALVGGGGKETRRVTRVESPVAGIVGRARQPASTTMRMPSMVARVRRWTRRKHHFAVTGRGRAMKARSCSSVVNWP